MAKQWVLVLATCAPACSPNTSGNTLQVCDGLSTMHNALPSRYTGSVFTIVMENHSRHEVIGDDDAPYITSLAKKYAVAEGYHDSFVHPSEANYLWMVSGENFHILDDDDPASHSIDSTSHIADQIERAGMTWKSYQEGMGSPCGLKSHGRYAAKHDPFVYFSDVNGWDGTEFQPSERCNEHVVDYTALDQDIAQNTVPRYAFITPDLDHDMHDGSVHDSDEWMKKEIPKIMASKAYQDGGAIFLLGDEGGGYPADDDPPFIIISDNVKEGFLSQADYNTSSYLKTVEMLLGVAQLPCVPERDTVEAMTDMFMDTLTTEPKLVPGSNEANLAAALVQ
jgi:phospholipase C